MRQALNIEGFPRTGCGHCQTSPAEPCRVSGPSRRLARPETAGGDHSRTTVSMQGTVLVSRDGTLVYVRRSTSPRGALDLEALMTAAGAAQHERSTA